MDGAELAALLVDEGREGYAYYSQRVETAEGNTDGLDPSWRHGDSPAWHRLNVWLGTTNATATAHYDAMHNLVVQVAGHKRWLVAPPEDYVTRPALRLASLFHPACVFFLADF